MASGGEQKKDREGDEQDAARRKKKRRRKLLGGLFVAILAIAAAAYVLTSGGEKKKAKLPPEGGAATAQLFQGIPQRRNELGSPGAPVTLHEYADLQCKKCGDYAKKTMPVLVRRYVREGKVRMVFHNVTFVGPDSDRASQAAIAAGEQNRMFQFVHLFLRNQGKQNSGYASDKFLRGVAAEVPGLDADKMMEARGSRRVHSKVAGDEAVAQQAQVHTVPSFGLARGKGQTRPLTLSPEDSAAFEKAIEKELAGS